MLKRMTSGEKASRFESFTSISFDATSTNEKMPARRVARADEQRCHLK